MVQNITTDDGVLFYWLIVTADFEIDDQLIHETLLKKIMEPFCTIRSFSLASVWLEKYKQCTKRLHNVPKASTKIYMMTLYSKIVLYV